MVRWLGPLLVVLLLLALAVSPIESFGEARTEPGIESVLIREPAATSAFLAAYARGDLAEADELASALYRAEWIRRGLSLDDRESLLPAYLTGPGHPAVWLRFKYVGGVVDARGFGHLLYTAEATGGDGDRSPSVWRVDTDGDGRVIWLELVGLLAPSPASVTTIAPTSNPSAMPLPSTPGSPRPCLLFGVRSSAGQEGYYALGLSAADATGASGCPARVIFLSVDEDGLVGPGAWTFGQSRPGLVTYGHVVPHPTARLPAGEESIRSAYIASLP